MMTEEHTARVDRRKVALYVPIAVGFVLAVATGMALSPYTGGMAFPGFLLGLLWVVLLGDIGEGIVVRYNL